MRRWLIVSLISCLSIQVFYPLGILSEPVKGVSESKKISLKSEKITLPQDSKLFTGIGSKHLNQYCLICHSEEYLNSQPALDKKMWEKEVLKMRSSYGAPIPTEDVEVIADELYHRFGAPVIQKK